MLVPAAENDRFRFFRRSSVVDPCGRVDTRPYEAVVGGRVDTRPYEALRFGTLAQPISILPQGDRKFSILNSQFSRKTAARVWPPYADPWPLVPDP